MPLYLAFVAGVSRLHQTTGLAARWMLRVAFLRLRFFGAGWLSKLVIDYALGRNFSDKLLCEFLVIACCRLFFALFCEDVFFIWT